MNEISFTGLKNMGGCTLRKNMLMGQYESKENYLLIHLSDDYKGRDLSDFRDAVKSCSPKLGSLTNKDDSRFLHIMTRTVRNTENEFDDPVPQLFINGKEIPAKRYTLPLFSYIAKLTRRIENMEDKDFVYNQDFKYGPDAKTYMLPKNNLDYVAESIGLDPSVFINGVYCAQTSKNNAKIINQDIQKKMLDYLG